MEEKLVIVVTFLEDGEIEREMVLPKETTVLRILVLASCALREVYEVLVDNGYSATEAKAAIMMAARAATDI